MKKYFPIIKKEFLQLVRDIPGLSILFLMPALMLILITLTQEKVLTGIESGLNVILVDNDSSMLGDSIYKELQGKNTFHMISYPSFQKGKNAVSQGKYQLMIFIPDSTTERFLAFIVNSLNDSLNSAVVKTTDKVGGVNLYFDPAINKTYKDALRSSIEMVIQKTALKIYLKKYNEEIISKFKSVLEKKIKKQGEIKLVENVPEYSSLIPVNEKEANTNESVIKPGLLQNNIPAFTLFAMFFIVIPLAGSIINEKQQGTRDRLKTLPVSYLTFLSGKITVYMLICFLQFLLMILIGTNIIPWLSNLPPLDMNVNIPALIAVAIASSLAAIGFGILVGTIAATHGQAATLGSVLVVILAILGGIFVPSYLMPNLIKYISIISPMRWGTDAFLNVFSRSAGIRIILPQLISLFGFFGLALIVSVKVFNKHK